MRREVPDDLKTAVGILMNDLEWLKGSQMEQNKTLAAIQNEQVQFCANCRTRHEVLEKDRSDRWDEVHNELAAIKSFKKVSIALIGVILTVGSILGLPALVNWVRGQ